MVGKATELAAAGYSLPGHLYSAGRVEVPDTCESEDALQHSVSRFLRGFAATGSRSEVHRRSHRHGRRAPHLDPRSDLTSSRSLHRPWRRAGPRTGIGIFPAAVFFPPPNSLP